ncbi:MAG: precorrin-4 C(11)-methyltransferase [Methanothermobacter sp.]|jgi:precorrin-4/cobalt-precorrin-4 C11-methyltransferase|nr:precorrin-4 C(11)-methyltransferase [Methanobacteriales archaeon]MDX9692562.1 precorrin-4 C(11)-methyltransferase [Methanothermobacter sp.]HOQ20052.1 precorrin-4 C(11)-methyltransferase [Methanothermobacter sp.]
MKGKVFFIGGGPGDPELLTLKAVKIIKDSDIIIYAGSLVNKKILDFASDSAEIYDSSSMTLDEIIDVMVDGADSGKIVARIHTGDPSIYGAIMEQMRELKKRNIPFDIIPGVSSLFAAAAALKRELTVPGVSQTVIITRPSGRTPVPLGEDLGDLASHNSTMCIFLGVHKIGEVVKSLKEHYNDDTPVAVVKRASWDDEEIIKGRLSDIEDKVKESNIKKTAIIIVGDVLEPGDFESSKLYDASFSHGYRRARLL